MELASNKEGRCDIAKLRELVNENTAGIMITNPSTLGLLKRKLKKLLKLFIA